MEMQSDDGAMRVRTKDCYVCDDAKEVLYGCRYEDLKIGCLFAESVWSRLNRDLGNLPIWWHLEE